MITTANRHLHGSAIQAGAPEPRPYGPALWRGGEVLPSLGVAAFLALAKVLELYATNAI